MDTNVLLEDSHAKCDGSTRCGVPARDVFSSHPATRWIALEDPGRQLQWAGRKNLGKTPMQLYLNDSAKTFEFVLRGELTDDAVENLEHAWITATSILHGKEVLVEVSALTAADAEGIELLYRMTGSGARLRAALPPHSEGFLRSLGVLVAAPPRPGSRPWILGLRRLFGLSA